MEDYGTRGLKRVLAKIDSMTDEEFDALCERAEELQEIGVVYFEESELEIQWQSSENNITVLQPIAVDGKSGNDSHDFLRYAA